MPRLFTGIEIPADIGLRLSGLRGGLQNARWVEPENYHITLRFIGDVDHPMAREIDAALTECRPREPLTIRLDGLDAFGGEKPRALLARVTHNPDLNDLQAEQERLMRRIGLEPERRKFIPHVTLARMRGISAQDVASHIAMRGRFEPLIFTARRFVLYSARESVGGGPYVVEADYPLG